MKKFLTLTLAIALLALGSMAWATSSLNSSRSNIYRLVYDTTVVRPAQVSALLSELDKMGPGVNEAKVLQLLRTQGINAPNLIVRIVPPGPGGGKTPAILILKNSADEATAREIAVSDSGVVSPKPIVIPKK